MICIKAAVLPEASSSLPPSRRESFDLIDGIERKIDEPVLFPVICHGCSNAELRLEFLLIDLQTLGAEIDLCFYFYRDDSVSIIDDKVDFTGAPIVGVVVRLEIGDRLKLLTDILFCERTLEFDEQLIPIQQRTLTETGHAGKQTYIQNKQLKGLQILIGF